MESSHPPIPEAETLRGVNIHLGYLSDKMTETKDDVKGLEGQIRDITSKFVSQSDFTEHLKADEDHETRIRALEQSLWKFVGASSIISAVVGIIISYVLKSF